MTLSTQLVLLALLADPARRMYGLELCAETGLPSGTIYPILARLEKVGWLAYELEDIDPSELGRPRRRYYRLEPNSLSEVKAAVHRAQASAQALGRLRPGLQGGA
ncbi:helix-turn-helix transcriptional regulator [Amycolatopsis sp. NPDC051102]|uniref:PadR family transcriptional regulator n=1 Tax=Amycolatopsis sp. NPDC051102 TaxID=3155163 RepID=UPI003425CACF